MLRSVHYSAAPGAGCNRTAADRAGLVIATAKSATVQRFAAGNGARVIEFSWQLPLDHDGAVTAAFAVAGRTAAASL